MPVRMFSVVMGLFLFGLGSPVFSQSFQIVDRTPAINNTFINLDGQIELEYQVVANDFSGTVIPVLVPNQPDLVNTTFLGTGATSNLSSLRFRVHLYDEPSLCAATLQFTLLLYSTSFEGSKTATPLSSDLLEVPVRDSDTELTHLISRNTTDLPYPLTGASQTTHFMTVNNVSQDIIDNQNYRIYFYADHNLRNFGWFGQWSFFLYPLNETGCTLNGALAFSGLDLISTPLYDLTNGTREAIEQAPINGGGEGRGLGEGINVYDITDVGMTDSDCRNTVRESISPNIGQIIFWGYEGFGAIVRAYRLYMGIPGCGALRYQFGAAPGENFQISDFSMSSEGDIEASLLVPGTWGSSSQLNSDYRVRWFLRTPNGLTSLSSETRSLTLSTRLGSGIANPADYSLEARVHNVATDAYVSTTNPGVHPLQYALTDIAFTHSDPTGDDGYLDPGEELSLTLQVDQDGSALPSTSHGFGIVVDTNGNEQVDSSDRFMTSDELRENDINFYTSPLQNTGDSFTRNLRATIGLLTAPYRTNIWFYFDTTITENQSRFRRYVSLQDEFGGLADINADEVRESFAYDFNSSNHLSDDWFASSGSEPESGGWAYDGGPWVAEGSGIASETYVLQSPIFALGRQGIFSFEHRTFFNTNDSAGSLEYRTRTVGGAWTNWANALDNLCPNCGLDDGIFSAPGSYFNGQRVWMTTSGRVESISLGLPISLSNAYPDESGQIQFRFVAGEPSASGSPQLWHIENVHFESDRLLDDNAFGIAFENYPLRICRDDPLSFKTDAPFPSSEVSFIWYETLTELANDTGTPPQMGDNGTIIPFSQNVDAFFTYYVEMSRGDLVRIIPVEVDESPGISLSQAIIQIRQTADSSWPDGTSILGLVDITNDICPED